MKKYLVFISVLAFGCFQLHAQTSKIENAGFENWEDVNIPNHPEPVDWSTIKTSDNNNINPLAPVNWRQCDTAHSGNYSVELFNVSIFGQVATGTLTNGRVHTPPNMNSDEGNVFTDTTDARWNTPFTSRPDSLVGWYMYFPVSGDRGSVFAILHTGTTQTPAVDNDTSMWIGTASFKLPPNEVNEWTRFSVPFRYYSAQNPQYILFSLTSGAGAEAQAGSRLIIDDLDVIYHPSGIKQFTQGNMKVYGSYGKLHVALQHVVPGTYRIRVYDILGCVRHETILTGSESKSVNVNLPPGMYIVQAKYGDHVMTKKIILN